MVASYTSCSSRRYGDRLDDDGREFIDFAVDGATRMQHADRRPARLLARRHAARTRRSRPTLEAALRTSPCATCARRSRRAGATVTCDPLPVVLADAAQLGQLLPEPDRQRDQVPRRTRRRAIHVGAEPRGGALGVLACATTASASTPQLLRAHLRAASSACTRRTSTRAPASASPSARRSSSATAAASGSSPRRARARASRSRSPRRTTRRGHSRKYGWAPPRRRRSDLPANRLRAAGAAGLAYVVLAGVENMEVLRAPAPMRAPRDPRRLRRPGARGATAPRGRGLARGLRLLRRDARRRATDAGRRRGDRRARPRPRGIAATAPLCSGRGRRRRGARRLRTAARPAAARRPLHGARPAAVAAARRLPRALAGAGRPLAAVLALTPLALAGAGTGAATVVFGLHSLWLGAASLWLLGGAGADAARAAPPRRLPRPGRGRGRRRARADRVPGRGRDLLRLGAGAAAPSRPSPGGVYVGSAVVYGVGPAAPALPARRSRPPPRCSR